MRETARSTIFPDAECRVRGPGISQDRYRKNGLAVGKRFRVQDLRPDNSRDPTSPDRMYSCVSESTRRAVTNPRDDNTEREPGTALSCPECLMTETRRSPTGSSRVKFQRKVGRTRRGLSDSGSAPRMFESTWMRSLEQKATKEWGFLTGESEVFPSLGVLNL